MSSDSDGWNPVSSGSRSSRRSRNQLIPSQAQGPPAMNTRSAAFAAHNFANRQRPANRFIPSPEFQELSSKSGDSKSIRSSHSNSNSIDRANRSVNSTIDVPNTSPSVFLKAQGPTSNENPIDSLVRQDPIDREQQKSDTSVHVSDVSASESLSPPMSNHSSTKTLEPLFHDLPSNEGNSNPPNPSPSSTSTDIPDLGSYLDAQSTYHHQDNFNKQMFDTFHQLQQQIINLTTATQSTHRTIDAMNRDLSTLKTTAAQINPNLFGDKHNRIVSQQLHRVNQSEEDTTGLSYSPQESEQQQHQSNHAGYYQESPTVPVFATQSNKFSTATRVNNQVKNEQELLPSHFAKSRSELSEVQSHFEHQQDSNSDPPRNFSFPSKQFVTAQMKGSAFTTATVNQSRSQENVQKGIIDSDTKYDIHTAVPTPHFDNTFYVNKYKSDHWSSTNENKNAYDKLYSDDETMNYTTTMEQPRYYGHKQTKKSSTNLRDEKSREYKVPVEKVKFEENEKEMEKGKSPRASPTTFNTNSFYLLLSSTDKVKFDSIDTSLSRRSLLDDNFHSLEQLYNGIMRSLGVGLQSSLHFVPQFRQLNQDTSFFDIFLGNLHGLNFEKAFSVYDTLGQYIKERLQSTKCISSEKAPKAYDVIHSFPSLDGWSLLEKLVKKRLIICGARPDRDLFGELLLIQLQDGESLLQFFRRMQELENEFAIMLVDTKVLIPKLRLNMRFVTELMRCQEYRTYLVSLHQQLLQYEKVHGDLICKVPLPCTLMQIYEHLDDCRVSKTPRGRLLPSPNKLPVMYKQQQRTAEQVQQPSISLQQRRDNVDDLFDGDNYVADEEPLDDHGNEEFIVDSWYCQETLEEHNDEQEMKVIISAMTRRMAKKFCHACLTPGHEAHQCFLRGPAFRPKELTARLLIYNQQHGEEPPQGTVIPKWNPRTPPAFTDKLKKNGEHVDKKGATKKSFGPFKNSPNKSTVQKPALKSMAQEQSTSPSVTFHPTLSEFVKVQDEILDSFEGDEEIVETIQESTTRSFTATMSMMKNNNNDTSQQLLQYHHPFNETMKVYDYTPQAIARQLFRSHKNRIQRPHAEYIKQYSINIGTLPMINFLPACTVKMNVDSGANVFSVKTRKLLIVFFETETKVDAVDGHHFISPGWGIGLALIDEKPVLLAPVYECPDNPQNTFSPGALKVYSSFDQVMVDCHSKILFTDDKNNKSEMPLEVENGLDFVCIKFLAFSDNMVTDPNNNAYSLLTEGHDNLGGRRRIINAINLPDLSDTTTFIFPKQVMSLIGYYFVLLHEDKNPRTSAINNFNQLMYPTIDNRQILSRSPVTVPKMNAFDVINNNNETQIVPIIAKMFRRTTRVANDDVANYIMVHLLLSHISKDHIVTMIKKKCYDDMPSMKKVHNMVCQCAICQLSKATRIPRGQLTDVSTLEPFKRLHMDFAFYSVTSIRGFTSNLTIVCASTSYPFAFPTKSKSSPLDLVRWFIETLRKIGRDPVFVRVDEDGALAKCSHFCELIVNLECVLESTGGSNSENNGKVERPHGTLANMMRASLYNAKYIFGDKLPKNMTVQNLWCFALQHSAYTMRRVYNRMRKNTPYFLVHGKRPSLNHLAIFGSRVVIVETKNQKMKKLTMDRSSFGYFLSFGNNVNNILYWTEDDPKTYNRAHHAIIDDVYTFDKLKSQFKLMSTTTDIPPDQDIDKSEDFVDLVPLQDGPFPDDEIRTCTFALPPLGQSIGLTLDDDNTYNLPYIVSTKPGTAAYDGIPSTYRQNTFILNINKEGPLNTTYAVKMLRTIQRSSTPNVMLDLVKRPAEARQTSLSISRAMFDQLPNLAVHKPVINSIDPVIPDSHAHFITSASKPENPKDIFTCFKGPHRANWIAACKVAYHKNRKVAVFALPVPKRDLKDGTKVCKTKLVGEYKATDVPQIYELKVRDCTVGTSQVKGVDFPESYCATIDPTTWKLMLCVSAAINNVNGIMDVKNAFQQSIAKEEFRIFTTCPPFYLEWLTETEGIQFEKGVTYVRQALNGNQGTKPASHIWYQLLKPILLKYGFVMSTVDHAFFVKCYEGPPKRYHYVGVATDDLLNSAPSWQHFDDLRKYLEMHFELTVQTGKILQFLGNRIIQTDMGVSVDQAEYLFDLVSKHFGDKLDDLKTALTPMRYDNLYEKDLFESKPLSPIELKEYSLKYGGGYRYHTGKFNFASCQTRGDITYATQRLSEYNNAPTAVAFQGVGHMYRYIAGDILRPLFFPKGNFTDQCYLTYFDGEKDIPGITVPNELQLYSDAELARNLSDRKSYMCNVVMIMNVCIMIKVQKSTTIMTHTTDSETKATFAGVRRLLPIRRLLEFMGFPCSKPTTAHIDNAALDAIITAERITRRSRHLDIPIAYLHEHNNVTYVPRLIRTYYMLADVGTKPLNVQLHRRFKYWLMGAQFYPVPETEHYKLLEMNLYEQSYIVIIRSYNNG